MRLVFNIIFLLTGYPLLLIMYYLLLNAKDRNSWCFGVTLGREYKKSIEVEAVDVEYRKNLKNTMIVFAIMPIVLFFIKHVSIIFTFWMIWVLAICFLPMYWYAKANKKIRVLKEQNGWNSGDATDDDRHWYWGLMYHNPKDTRFMVENRMGTGTAVNMATGAGKGMYILAALCLLIIPISCVWMIMLDFTPISSKVEKDTIVCTHLSVEYEIPLKDIENYTILTELPEMTKVSGNGMNHVLSGRYEIYREGMFETFLNPQNDLFIKIETDKETYYISGVDDNETQSIIDELEK